MTCLLVKIRCVLYLSSCCVDWVLDFFPGFCRALHFSFITSFVFMFWCYHGWAASFTSRCVRSLCLYVFLFLFYFRVLYRDVEDLFIVLVLFLECYILLGVVAWVEAGAGFTTLRNMTLRYNLNNNLSSLIVIWWPWNSEVEATLRPLNIDFWNFVWRIIL
jgi:hypothetical protein